MFDKVIEEELLFVYDEALKFVPDKALVQLCRLPYDVHNVKVILKSNFLHREGGERKYELLTPLGNISTDQLLLAIEGEEYTLLPQKLALAVQRSLSLWEQTKNLQEIECYLDRWLFETMSTFAQKLENSEVVAWVRAKIDAENLRALLRLKRLDSDPQAAMNHLHPGGKISVNRLLSLLSEPVESWGRLLATTDLGGAFSSLQEGTDIASMLVELERLLDEFCYKIIETSKYGAFAPANVLLFLWLKELEAKNLRIALVSVANGTDKDMARRLIRRV